MVAIKFDFLPHLWALVIMFSLSHSTDILVTYHQGVSLIKNADTINADEKQVTCQSLALPLHNGLAYPVGITFDYVEKLIYIADKQTSSIYSINFAGDYKMNLIHKTKNYSTIDSMTFTDSPSQLTWIDSSHNEICSLELSDGKQQSNVQPDCFSTLVHNPRGVAVDACKRLVFWSERGKRSGTIEVKYFDDDEGFINHFGERGEYFQGLSFDETSGELIVGKTESDDEERSACSILGLDERRKITNYYLNETAGCYPFSVVFDDKYIYWSDWNKEAIMRLSRTNSSDLVSLVACPKIVNDTTTYFGPYSLTVIKSKYGNNCTSDIGKSSSRMNMQDGESINTYRSPKNLHNKIVVDVNAENNDVNYVTDSAKNGSFNCNKPWITILLLCCTVFFFITSIFFWRVTCLKEKHVNYINNTSHSFEKTNSQLEEKNCNNSIICSTMTSGVKIDIEDCCGMKLCSSPCKVMVNKDKLFKKCSSSEDKQILMCNTDNF